MINQYAAHTISTQSGTSPSILEGHIPIFNQAYLEAHLDHSKYRASFDIKSIQEFIPSLIIGKIDDGHTITISSVEDVNVRNLRIKVSQNGNVSLEENTIIMPEFLSIREYSDGLKMKRIKKGRKIEINRHDCQNEFNNQFVNDVSKSNLGNLMLRVRKFHNISLQFFVHLDLIRISNPTCVKYFVTVHQIRRNFLPMRYLPYSVICVGQTYIWLVIPLPIQ